MTRWLALPGLLLCAPLAFVGLAQGPDRLTFHAELRGENEVPPVDTDTTGRVRIRFARDLESAEVQLDLRNGERITQAHFQCGIEGENGPVVLFLAGFHDRGWDVDGRWIGGVTLTDENIVDPTCGSSLREIAEAMADGRIYANVHSVEFPAGVVRGQLGP